MQKKSKTEKIDKKKLAKNYLKGFRNRHANKTKEEFKKELEK